MLSPFRKGLSFLFLILFTAASALSILDIPAQMILFRPERYENALAKTGFSTKAAVWLYEIMNGGSGSRVQSLVNNALLYDLTPADYQTLYALVFTQDWVDLQGEMVIEQTWKFLNFESDDLHLYVDMSGVKTRMQGRAGQMVAYQLISTWPDCSAEQSLELTASLLTGGASGKIPFCKPFEPVLGEMARQFGLALDSAANQIPAVIDLTTDHPINNQAPGFLIYRDLRMFLGWSPMFALAFLACLAASSGVTDRSLHKWLGVGILSSGAAAGFISGLLGISTNLLAGKLLEAIHPLTSEVLGTALQQMLTTVMNQTCVVCLVLSVVTAVSGLLIWLSGRRHGTRPHA